MFNKIKNGGNRRFSELGTINTNHLPFTIATGGYTQFFGTVYDSPKAAVLYKLLGFIILTNKQCARYWV